MNEEISGSYYNSDAWEKREVTSLTLGDVLSPVSAVFPSISFDGIGVIQVETSAWIDGALGQTHGGSDEVFVGISENVHFEAGKLYVGDVAVASFNKNVHLEVGAYCQVLTDG